MDKSKILELYNKHWNVAKTKYNLTIPQPKVLFTSSGATAGKAWRDGSKVLFNTTLAMTAGSAFENTITHEIAHIVQFRLHPRSKPHGLEFSSIHKALGGSGERCHSYSLEALPNRHPYTCGCSDFFLSTQRHNKIRLYGASFSCRKCGNKLVSKK